MSKGIRGFQKGNIPSCKRSENLDYRNRNWLYQRYIIERKSMTMIAEICNCCISTICEWLKRFDIKVRTTGEVLKGRALSKKHKENLSIAGKKFYKKNPGFRSGENSPMFGKTPSEETREKMSEAKLGEANPKFWLGKKRPDLAEKFKGSGNPCWKEDKSNELYNSKFNYELKLKIRKRDEFACQMLGCGIREAERAHDIHHIDYNKKNDSWDNLITLCGGCHNKTGANRDYWQWLLSMRMLDKKRKRKPKIFFSADLHLNHKNIIQFCQRPFKDVNEMNKTLITNWNAKVSAGDLIYILGDFGFGDLKNIIKSLHGFKVLIIGSHDRTTLKHKSFFVKTVPLLELTYEGMDITLCHYCMRTWPKSHYNKFHLFGHSHGRLEPIGKSHDVGVDNNNFFPLSFDEIAEIMKDRPDNPGYTRIRGFYRQKLDEEEME